MNYEQWMNGLVATGDTVTNTTTKTQFTNARLELGLTNTGTTVTGPSELQYGRAIDVDLHGILTTDATTPGSLTMTIDWGNGASSPTYTVLGTTGAFTPPAGLSNSYWTIKGKVIFNLTGAAGIATFSGCMILQSSANTPLIYSMVATTTSGTSGWATSLVTNSGINNLVAASVTWGSALSTNSITLSGGSRMARIA
jgi:hypothetical protein